ncbi:putative quinol monooxygenase [Kineococcus gynurae]|uniref:Quinol monooxygenase n=1 Tax=Kineococcus gynurae TaxID=452979 RepID=A0ABV5LW81_9ACTN
MIIVAGWLAVAADRRSAYLDEAAEVVRLARAAEGCLDFCLSPDPSEPGRIRVDERWADRATLDAFRGDGVQGEQAAAVQAADVAEFEIIGELRPG